MALHRSVPLPFLHHAGCSHAESHTNGIFTTNITMIGAMLDGRWLEVLSDKIPPQAHESWTHFCVWICAPTSEVPLRPQPLPRSRTALSHRVHDIGLFFARKSVWLYPTTQDICLRIVRQE